MTETTTSIDERLGLPEDLRQWLEPQTLVKLVLDALHHAIERMFTLSAWAGHYRVCALSGTVLTPTQRIHGNPNA